MHILLVDDDPENSVALADILKAEGHSVNTASDGYEALDVARSNSFDVIVSDALMPRMDGFVLCRTIRSDEILKDMPVIIMTGEYTGAADEQFAISVGASRVLRKTGNADELISAITHFDKKGNGDRTGSPSLDEDEYLKGYSSLLFRRLEAKMAELEAVNRRLVEQNAQLEHERRKYRQLFASANDGILLVDQSAKEIVESNSHARKILKLSEKNISMKKLDDLKPFGELLVEKISRGEAVQFESSYEHGNSRTALDISGSPVGTEDNLYIIIMRNVTRRKEWLERFIALDKLRALGRLSHGLVHEIRNPLNVVSVNLQYLDRTSSEDSPEKKLAKTALQGVNAIEKVIRETMNFAQPQTPAKTQLRVGAVLSEIAALARTSLQKSRITLTIENSTAEDTILADKSQILHALLNIVENAIEAMPNGGNLLFKLEDEKDCDELILRIRDTGAGMDDETAKLAIEPFYSTREGSTGMGLSISNRLFELNDAGLSYESKIGVGTTVTVRFQRRR
ncbi:MAG: response regulator [Bacteroidetes bacterium]|nr:response regulator [Bacteroidota bacterium]